RRHQTRPAVSFPSTALFRSLRIPKTPWPLVVSMTIALVALSSARADDDAPEGSCKIEPAGEVPVAIQSDPPGAILLIRRGGETVDRKSTRLNSSHGKTAYAV